MNPPLGALTAPSRTAIIQPMNPAFVRALVAMASVVLLVAATAPSETGPSIDRSDYRIGYSADGNQHDPDDIAASAMAMAFVGAAGLPDRLVHFDYSNHLGDSSVKHEKLMTQSVRGAAERWKIPAEVLFDDQAQLDAAIASIARQINASSEANRFYLIAAGPMEVVWRGIDASDPAKRPFCTVISHSKWNDSHGDTPLMRHKWVDVARSGVKTIHITDQNKNLSTDRAEWSWLDDASHPDWRWLHSRAQYKKLFDVSDAGMMWFVITGRGDQSGDSAKVRELFTSHELGAANRK